MFTNFLLRKKLHLNASRNKLDSTLECWNAALRHYRIRPWPFYLWPWKFVQQFPLTWWIFVASFIEIPPPSKETLTDRQRSWTVDGQPDWRTENTMPPRPITGTGIKRTCEEVHDSTIELRANLCQLSGARETTTSVEQTDLVSVKWWRQSWRHTLPVDEVKTRNADYVDAARRRRAFGKQLGASDSAMQANSCSIRRGQWYPPMYSTSPDRTVAERVYS